MSRTRKHPKRRKPFHPVKTFFKVMLSIVMVFVVLAGGACFAYHKVTGEWPFGGDTIAKDADETSMLDALLGRNMKLNVAVFGVDADGTRTEYHQCRIHWPYASAHSRPPLSAHDFLGIHNDP